MKVLRRGRRLILAAIAVVAGAGFWAGQTVVIRHRPDEGGTMVSTIFGTEGGPAGDWRTNGGSTSLHTALDDASNSDYIWITVGEAVEEGFQDWCEISLGSVAAYQPATAISMSFSVYSTTGQAPMVRVVKNVDLAAIIQYSGQTIAPSVFVDVNIDWTSNLLDMWNQATMAKVEITGMAGATSRVGFFSMTVTHEV